MQGKCTAAKEKKVVILAAIQNLSNEQHLFLVITNNISHSKLLSGFQSRVWITQ